MTSLPVAAMDLATSGWAILPLHSISATGCTCQNPHCPSPGKHPVASLVRHGLRDASNDRGTVTRWWSRFPAANIGIPTGSLNGIVVIDVDGADGEESVRQITSRHAPLPLTLTVTTGRGRHLYFEYRGPTPIQNSAGKLGPKLDVRGEGGQVVAPPSLHHSGRVYGWKRPMPPIAPLPEWLRSLLQSPSKRPAQAPASISSDEALLRRARVYVAKADGVGEGCRNSTAFRLAGHLASFIGEHGEALTESEIAALLADFARRCTPPLHEEEVVACVRSAMKNGTAREPKPPRPRQMRRRCPHPAAERPPMVLNGGKPEGELMTERTVFPCTDLGNACRFALDWAGRACWVPGIGWMSYDGTRWIRATSGQHVEFAKETVRKIFIEVSQEPDSGKQQKLSEWALASQKHRAIEAMLKLAQSDPGIVLPADRLDIDSMLLNCQNGTIDLRAGNLRRHKPGDRITKICPISYDASAPCPKFMQTLERAFASNKPLISYVQRVLGMACSGSASEQYLPIFSGEGANGKSTILGAVQYVLGDYACTAPDTLLTLSKRSEHPCELADLFGKRLVIASETEVGSKLRLQLVKKLTGEATIKARFMYGDFFEFRRTHTIILQTNHKPEIDEDTEAAWRRIRVVPWDVIVPERERDPHLLEKLKGESAGILAWLVEGCMAWQKVGLEAPDAVKHATQVYREESDPTYDFVRECCIIGSNAKVEAGTLRKEYEGFMKERGVEPVDIRKFAKSLERRGCESARERGKRIWRGIGLLHPEFSNVNGFEQPNLTRDA